MHVPIRANNNEKKGKKTLDIKEDRQRVNKEMSIFILEILISCILFSPSLFFVLVAFTTRVSDPGLAKRFGDKNVPLLFRTRKMFEPCLPPLYLFTWIWVLRASFCLRKFKESFLRVGVFLLPCLSLAFRSSISIL